MLQNKTIAVIVPCYNEEKLIGLVIESMPAFVDRIIIVNDCSSDKTEEVVKSYFQRTENKGWELPHRQPEVNSRFSHAGSLMQKQYQANEKHYSPCNIINDDDPSNRIILINLAKNSGNGSAIARGLKWAMDKNIDCSAVMDGDGQMDPCELESIVAPIINGQCDYVKGNRLIHRSAWLVMPRARFIGNSILSIFTKIASGYWHVTDSQCGFVALSAKALQSLRLYNIYKSYGWPNDILVKLNIAFCTIKEVEIKPLYDVGEKSKMKIWKIIPLISWLLLKSFVKRLWVKYLFRDFHPLFILYNLSFVLLLVSIPYLIKILNAMLFSELVSSLPVLAFIFLFITGVQFLLFAMWMDIQDNERLYK